MELCIAIGLASFGFGAIVGAVLNHFAYTREALSRNEELVKIMYRMKKRGFVPQFDFEQVKVLDPSENIKER